MNPGLLTCEASALPLSYIPDDVSQFVFPTCLVKQARQKNKRSNRETRGFSHGNTTQKNNSSQKQQILHNTHAQKKWRYRDLNPGLLTCEASALPLSYIPDDVSQFVFPTMPSQTSKAKTIKYLEIPGFEPGASHMRSERSTTELYPR